MCEGLKPRASYTQGCPGSLAAREDGALASWCPAQGVLAPVTRPRPLTCPETQTRLCQETCRGSPASPSPPLLRETLRALAASVSPGTTVVCPSGSLGHRESGPGVRSHFPPFCRVGLRSLGFPSCQRRSRVPSEHDPQLTVTFPLLSSKGGGHGGGCSGRGSVQCPDVSSQGSQPSPCLCPSPCLQGRDAVSCVSPFLGPSPAKGPASCWDGRDAWVQG